MKFEKSCGAVCAWSEGGRRQVLMVRHIAGGRWAFPKGHVEAGESEPQTALREVLEETGVRVILLPEFRFVTNYSPVKGTMKKVVYFAARACSNAATPQPGEIEEARFFDAEEAMSRLTYPADKHLLRRVLKYLDAQEAPAAEVQPSAAETAAQN